MQYVLPLMLTVMTARLVGNIFTEGIYDEHIHSRKLAYLDEDEGVSSLMELHDLTVSEIMTPRPYCMEPVMRVGQIYDILKLSKHHYYPVGKIQGGGKGMGEGGGWGSGEGGLSCTLCFIVTVSRMV